MIKFILYIILTFSIKEGLQATDVINYVIADGGLSLREQPNPESKIVAKIPDKAKIIVQSDIEKDTAETEVNGLPGKWIKIIYGNKDGYIFNSYLFPIPPPDIGFTNLKEYLGKYFTFIKKENVLHFIGTRYDNEEKVMIERIFFKEEILYTYGHDGVEGASTCIESNYFTLQNYFQLAKRFKNSGKFSNPPLFPFGIYFANLKNDVEVKDYSYRKIDFITRLNNKPHKPFKGIAVSKLEQEETPHIGFTIRNYPTNGLCLWHTF